MTATQTETPSCKKCGSTDQWQHNGYYACRPCRRARYAQKTATKKAAHTVPVTTSVQQDVDSLQRKVYALTGSRFHVTLTAVSQ